MYTSLNGLLVPLQELTMGLSFSDKDEALLFGQAVESRLSRRNGKSGRGGTR